MFREASFLASAMHRRTCLRLLLGTGAALLGGCGGTPIGEPFPPAGQPLAQPGPPPGTLGTGEVRVALLLPLSAGGNAGLAAQAMRNAAEMALAEFQNPDIQLLVRDDAGTAQGARAAAEQAISEGVEIILGPLFAHSVAAAGQVARGRGISVIAFSTDAGVAARGVYLLSFLPESDVERIVDYAASRGRRSAVALIPDNAYGSVAEGAFQQAAAKRGMRIVAIERYPPDRSNLQGPVERAVRAVRQADSLFIPDSGDNVVPLAQALAGSGVDLQRLQLLGTGLWEADPRIAGEAALHGGWFAAPDSAGFHAFAQRYRARFGQDPIRTATLAYDGVALLAALTRTQGRQRFTEEVLTSSSGFTGIDGVFRFRSDGTNQRGLAVMRITAAGGEVISPAPRAFAAGM